MIRHRFLLIEKRAEKHKLGRRHGGTHFNSGESADLCQNIWVPSVRRGRGAGRDKKPRIPVPSSRHAHLITPAIARGTNKSVAELIER